MVVWAAQNRLIAEDIAAAARSRSSLARLENDSSDDEVCARVGPARTSRQPARAVACTQRTYRLTNAVAQALDMHGRPVRALAHTGSAGETAATARAPALPRPACAVRRSAPAAPAAPDLHHMQRNMAHRSARTRSWAAWHRRCARVSGTRVARRGVPLGPSCPSFGAYALPRSCVLAWPRPAGRT